MTYAGIDIGAAGALAFIGSPSGSVPYNYQRMPLQTTGKRQEVDVMTLSNYLGLERPDNLTVVVEECPHHSRDKAAMRSMALSFGKIIALLEIRRLRFVIVPAPKWQKALLGKVPAGLTKEAAQTFAQRLWPRENFIFPGCRVPHDGLIDACLIAEWARRNNL